MNHFRSAEEDMMQERIRRMEHKGKTVVVVDYSNMSAEEATELTRQLPAKLQGMRDLRILIDAMNTRGSPESVAAMKEVLSSIARTGSAEGGLGYIKTACVGITGLGRIFLDALSRISPAPVRAFGSQEEALDWLVEHETARPS